MIFKVLTIFPKIFDSYLNEGILKKAISKQLIKLQIYNLRDFTTDRHKTVDDAPFGGGAGMLMKIEPIYLALMNLKKGSKNKKRKIILLSASGRQWSQKLAQKYSKLDELILICGRYEGVDARVKNFIDEEISIGEYVVTGGELPALIMIDSISRLRPGILGNQNSLLDESFNQSGKLEYPQYTRPEIFQIEKKKYIVPKILLSGNHQKIKTWQESKRKNQKI